MEQVKKVVQVGRMSGIEKNISKLELTGSDWSSEMEGMMAVGGWLSGGSTTSATRFGEISLLGQKF